MAYFPFMAEIKDWDILVVGGGRAAWQKVRVLLPFGVVITVTAPDISEAIKKEAFKNPQIVLIRRKFEKEDLNGRNMVIAATGDMELNCRISGLCRERRIPVNVVDAKEECDFIFPAIIKKEGYTVSVCTEGRSPLLAKRIKEEIGKQFPKELDALSVQLGKIREEVKKEIPSEAGRVHFYGELIDEVLLEKTDRASASGKKLRIGTRGSALALVQADMVIDALLEKFPKLSCEKVILHTKGDQILDRPLMDFGGKAVFVSEFEEAIQKGEIDLAVHSAKDMPVTLMEGLVTGAVLKRADVRDILITRAEDGKIRDKKGLFREKPGKWKIGTSSLRRQVQICGLGRDILCESLRGNVPTRMEKLKNGEYDAIILAAAGIKRLKLEKDTGLFYDYLGEGEMLPAAGQGVIAVECQENSWAETCLREISDSKTYYELETERYFMERAGAGCHEAVGALATLADNQVFLKIMWYQNGCVFRRDGKALLSDRFSLADKMAKIVKNEIKAGEKPLKEEPEK